METHLNITFICILPVFLLLCYRRACFVRYFLSSTLLTAYACCEVAVGSEMRQKSDNKRALYKPNVSALTLLQPVLRSLYLVCEISLLIFHFFAFFHFIALVTSIPYLLSYNVERDRQS
jgi:hypothetical protein